MRPTVMEINTNNFKYNIEQIRKKLKPEVTIMPIIKANAYGTYINTKLDIINEFEIVGVAITDEGAKLRELGYQKEIFILNQPAKSEISKIIENNLTFGLSSFEFLEELMKENNPITVHLEIETGMGRTGILLEELPHFINKVQENPNIKIEGIYTHLSSPDIDAKFTKEQLQIFEEAIKIVKTKVSTIKYIHCSASNGIINFPEANFNLVRPGMIMYGYESAEGVEEKISLKPVVKLKSEITLLKTLKEGANVSYSRSFITKKESKIATIPIGYADGLRRNLSNNGFVVIHNQRVPIIGKVCMDSFMADVTDLNDVKVGDEVWIWDNEHLTLDELAHRCDTINYEIISTISERVPRVFN